jgi:hypothetical protein
MAAKTTLHRRRAQHSIQIDVAGWDHPISTQYVPHPASLRSSPDKPVQPDQSRCLGEAAQVGCR